MTKNKDNVASEHSQSSAPKNSGDETPTPSTPQKVTDQATPSDLGYEVRVGENEEGEEYTELLYRDGVDPIASDWGECTLEEFAEDIAKHQIGLGSGKTEVTNMHGHTEKEESKPASPWTPEPWANNPLPWNGDGEYVTDANNRDVPLYVHRKSIVACVNSLVGVKNPEKIPALIEMAKRLVSSDLPYPVTSLGKAISALYE